MAWTKIIVVLTWLVSAVVSFCINTFNSVVYEPAVLLCVPSLPKEVFLSAVCIMGVVIVIIIIAFIGTYIYLRKQQARVDTSTNSDSKNYKDLEKSLCSNFFLTVFHIM